MCQRSWSTIKEIEPGQRARIINTVIHLNFNLFLDKFQGIRYQYQVIKIKCYAFIYIFGIIHWLLKDIEFQQILPIQTQTHIYTRTRWKW